MLGLRFLSNPSQPVGYGGLRRRAARGFGLRPFLFVGRYQSPEECSFWSGHVALQCPRGFDNNTFVRFVDYELVVSKASSRLHAVVPVAAAMFSTHFIFYHSLA